MWPDGDGSNPSAPSRASSGSEVVVLGDQLATATRELPSIGSMNIHRSRVDNIGPKFVTITQTVHNNEVVEGRFLGLELVSPKQSRRLRCSVAVFVCWALVLACGLAIYLFRFTLLMKTRLDIGLNDTWYLRRPDWQALPPSSTYDQTFLQLPVKNAVFGHSVTACCQEKRECIVDVKNIQKQHIEQFGEIGPNFLVGGKGLVFEGAGANVQGAVIRGWNSKMISIMFLGNYEKCVPNQAQLDNVSTLLDTLVKDNILDPNYKLYGQCQIATYTIPPGPNIMSRINEFSHWSKENATTCRK